LYNDRNEVTVMRTTVTKRAQTVVPAALRKRFGIKGGDFLEWIDDGRVIKVIPIPTDPIQAIRGSAKGEHLVAKLIESRREDKKYE
jgi:AbrB family looped-hinge helix DNA binding protein